MVWPTLRRGDQERLAGSRVAWCHTTSSRALGSGRSKAKPCGCSYVAALPLATTESLIGQWCRVADPLGRAASTFTPAAVVSPR